MVKTKRGVWLYSIAVTVVVDASVAPLVMMLAPRAEWYTDVPPALALATLLSIVFSVFAWRQNLRGYQLTQELRALLERDKLTDVATRDFFFKRMAEAPDAYGLSLMVDIDHFKTVNDTYGHIAGDAVIRHVAQILQKNTRSKDIVCRFGGEEFIVFLFGVGMENGLDVAERIRRVVEAEVMRHDGLKFQVTVSIGGSLKDRTDEVNRAIRKADEALYRAKQLGRNRSIMSWVRTDGSVPDAA
ncbi:GGDEF domain-containing protein [Aliiruegeria sabulilitoris]|uniref:GGDEF domain-containing protein n=1 Tax=Aliiruegeria sabulilitoris TaxID=1510458 RepID=UPI00082CAEA6|nr:GGDEF domain-containing protein [Aliiruegeria sabulilitoris]